MKNLTLFFILFISISASSQNSMIKSGPMVGYTNTREASIWIQTSQNAELSVQYYISGHPEKKWQSVVKNTHANNEFIAKFILDSILPGNTYEYEIYINQKQTTFNFPLRFKTPPVWRYQTDPPEFTIACGSGTFINEEKYDRAGKPYGGEYNIFTSIANKQPDVMLWLGDNIYLRADEWNSKTGIASRYTHTRSTQEMQALLASSSNYAIWDDHDAGPNDCDRSFWNIDEALNYFELFWLNPSVGVKDIKGAISYFNWGDADFFLLDNRYYREPNDLKAEGKTMLGEKQLKWLKESLTYSKATFKIVVIGGQVLNTAKNYETYSNHGFKQERDEILSFIQNQKIKGVFFLDGDRHFTELSKLSKTNAPTIYDLTVSPLTSGVGSSSNTEENNNRVNKTLVQQRNFALLHFSGKLKNRQIKIEIFDANGKIIWNKVILENQF